MLVKDWEYQKILFELGVDYIKVEKGATDDSS